MVGMNHLTGDPLQQTEFRLHGDTGRNVQNRINTSPSDQTLKSL